MPRLLQINVTYKYGSTGRIADSIGDLAISHGWESWIAYGRELSSAKGSKSHITGENLALQKGANPISSESGMKPTSISTDCSPEYSTDTDWHQKKPPVGSSKQSKI